MIHFVVPWQNPSWPVKRGRSSTERGFFSELDKENLLKEFYATLTMKNILAKYSIRELSPYAKQEVVTFQKHWIPNKM